MLLNNNKLRKKPRNVIIKLNNLKIWLKIISINNNCCKKYFRSLCRNIRILLELTSGSWIIHRGRLLTRIRISLLISILALIKLSIILAVVSLIKIWWEEKYWKPQKELQIKFLLYFNSKLLQLSEKMVNSSQKHK